MKVREGRWIWINQLRLGQRDRAPLNLVVRRMRKLLTGFIAISLALSIAARSEGDALCDELARFGSSSYKVSPIIQFTTDWSMRPDPDDPHSYVWGTKTCDDGNSQPGRELCEYLLGNTSTEFPEVNYRRVLRCLGSQVPLSLAQKARLPHRMTSNTVLGVRVPSALTVEFVHGNDEHLPLMKISAAAR
jgi:hypothetical protein